MNGAPIVSVVVPSSGGDGESGSRCRTAVERYLETTGFKYEWIAAEGSSYGAAVRRGASEARGDVIVVIDPELPYAVSAIGHAVAMVQSNATDVVFAAPHGDSWRAPALLRWLLDAEIPHPHLRLKAFSSSAAKLIVGESRLVGEEVDLELAFLANKYGFRVERLAVELLTGARTVAAYDGFRGLVPAIRIRLTNRNMGYRAARRCPVCFSSEVWTCAQIPGNVIRACRRCKCRYLNQFAGEDDTHPVRRVLRPHVPAGEVEEPHSESAREKTSLRRLAALRKQLTARARVLEIGIRDGSFGAAASREFEFVGIDASPAVARHARGRGLDAYCATLTNFVNTGPAFDAIAIFHVFENMPEPHDALSRMKDLLKPGGILFMTTFDTEGLLYLLTERRRMPHTFRTHLILYSRSAMIELLENSGFEIDAIGPELEYRDHKFLRYLAQSRWPALAPVVRALLKILPDPLLIGSGSIRIVAKRRAGTPLNVRAIRSAEPTHAR
jgi:SAM-dependent methyltransferase